MPPSSARPPRWLPNFLTCVGRSSAMGRNVPVYKAYALNCRSRKRFGSWEGSRENRSLPPCNAAHCLPCRYEGPGCVYLEAMSTGKPTIGCRGHGLAEVIQHGSNGFLVGPDNHKELALAIAMLLKDETRRRNISIAARDTILDRFTLAHQGESLLRIYREAAE